MQMLNSYINLSRATRRISSAQDKSSAEMPQRTPYQQLGPGDHSAVHGFGCLLARQAGDAGAGKHSLRVQRLTEKMADSH